MDLLINKNGASYRTLNNHGSTLIGGIFTLLFFSFFGMALSQLDSVDATTSANHLQGMSALYVGQAGLEFAKMKVEMGEDPSIVDMPFGEGNFSITPDPLSSLITVVSEVGIAKKTQSIAAKFAKDCVALDTSTAHTDDNDLLDVKLNKTCNGYATVSKVWIEWNWDPCVTGAPDNATIADLENCPVTTGNAHVDQISLNDTPIYNSATGLGAPGVGGADSGEEIDVADYSIGTNGLHVFGGGSQPIRFGSEHPGRGLYTVTVEFADASQIEQTFRDTTATAVAVNFSVDNGAVVVDPSQTVRVEVLGSAITYGATGPEVLVTVDLGTSTAQTYSYRSLFGGIDVDGGESYQTSSGMGLNYVIRATARYRCYFYRRYASTNVLQVKSLVNGDLAPRLAGFGGQRPVTAFLAPYLDENGEVVLAANQVIMLFELGVNMRYTPTSTAADFQDLVVLFTISPE